MIYDVRSARTFMQDKVHALNDIMKQLEKASDLETWSDLCNRHEHIADQCIAETQKICDALPHLEPLVGKFLELITTQAMLLRKQHEQLIKNQYKNAISEIQADPSIKGEPGPDIKAGSGHLKGP